MSTVGWLLVVAGIGLQSWARGRDDALLRSLSEEVAARHATVSRSQIGGIVAALALFVGLGRGSLALSVSLAVLGASALGAALWRMQLPGPDGLVRWLVVELLASWTLYGGVALALWG